MAHFAVRCIFEMRANHPESPIRLPPGEHAYEERVTLWEADSFDAAVELAEIEAEEYAATLGATYLGLAQSFHLADNLGHGSEVFSLLRRSTLDPDEYLDRHFDTGSEFQDALVERPEWCLESAVLQRRRHTQSAPTTASTTAATTRGKPVGIMRPWL